MSEDARKPGRGRLLQRLMAHLSASDFALEVFTETRDDAKWSPDDEFWTADFVVVAAEVRFYILAVDGDAPSLEARSAAMLDVMAKAEALLDRVPDADAVVVVWLKQPDFPATIITSYDRRAAIHVPDGSAGAMPALPVTPVLDCIGAYIRPVTPSWESTGAETGDEDAGSGLDHEADMITATSAGRAIESIVKQSRSVRIEAKRAGLSLTSRDAAWVTRVLRQTQSGDMSFEDFTRALDRRAKGGVSGD